MSRYWAVLIVLVTTVVGQWQPVLQLTSGDGFHRTSGNNAWCVAAAGDVVHAVWWEEDGVCYSRSVDGGVIWSDKVVLSAGTRGVFPAVAVSGDDVHAVWVNYTEGERGIHYRRSTNGGAYWDNIKMLSASNDSAYSPSIAVSGDHVHVVWQSSLNSGEIRYSRSNDRGETWPGDVSLSGGGALVPSVAVSEAEVHVFWAEELDSRYSVWYNRSEDGGETWDGGVQLASALDRGFSVAVQDSNVHVVWNDGETGDEAEIYYMRSGDGGKNWGAGARLTRASGYSGCPSIAAGANNVCVVWEDRRDGNDANVYYKRSVDAGETWGADIQLTGGESGTSRYAPSVAATGSEVHVVFTGSDPGSDEQVYYRRYGRRGASIAGTAYHDENGSGSRQPVERGLSGWTVRLDPGPRYAVTDQNGNYLFHSLAAGQYTISEMLKNHWQVTYPAAPGAHIVTVTSAEKVTGKDFGNRAVRAVQDLTVSIAGGPARPGFEKRYAIAYENAGTVPVAATVKLVLPTDVTYESSSPAGTYTPGTHTVMWDLGMLQASVTGTISVTVRTAVVPIGTELTASATIEPLAGDISPEDNTDSKTETVRGSYDPNMITVSPEPYVQPGGILDCTIYFQNVGNDTAFDVVVRQMPDPGLDATSFRPLASSHTYAFGFSNTGEMVWTFSDIELADSITNELGSHGFLRYTIAVKTDIEPGAVINSTAAIYFDYNPPVHTNNVQLTVTMPGNGWSEVESMPAGPTGKTPKDGAWLVVGPDGTSFKAQGARPKPVDSKSEARGTMLSVSNVVYAAKGNKSNEFYKYYPTGDSWRSLSPVPDTEPALGRSKPVSKGSCAASDGRNYLYVLKGNNTQGFWRYNLADGTWDTLARAPQKMNGGNDLAYVSRAGKECLYLLAGGKTAFYRYDVGTGKWSSLDSVPFGNNKKKYAKGSFLVYDGENALYAHQANVVGKDSHHFMFRYDLGGDSWHTAPLKGMPWLGAEDGREGKKKKSKDGGAGVWYNGCLYALKGGGSQGFYKFDPSGAGQWTALETVPRNGSGGQKAVKAGADLVSFGLGAFFALKGNKTRELWQYVVPAEYRKQHTEYSGGAQVGGFAVGRQQFSVYPNPIADGFATLRIQGFNGSRVRGANLRVFDAAGRCVLVHQLAASNRQTAVPLDLRKLSAGVYLVRLDATGVTVSRKLVVRPKQRW